MTYPNEAVQAELNERFVPLKVESAREPELAKRYGVRWLPAMVVVDTDERAAHSITGFLPPEELLTELEFARGISAMANKRYDEAHALFEKVARTEGAERAPEACYWWGVSRFRQSKDFYTAVTEPWGMIVQRWPASQWAKKVGFALRPKNAG